MRTIIFKAPTGQQRGSATPASRLYDNGTISQAARQRLQRGLDLEAARLGDEQR